MMTILSTQDGVPIGGANPFPVILYGAAGQPLTPDAAALADGQVNPTTSRIGALLQTYDETAWNRQRGNTQGTLLASAARTASTLTPNQTNYNASKLTLFLRVTANPGGAETLTLAMLLIDPVSGANQFATNFSAEPAATNGIFLYHIGLGALESVALSFSQVSGIHVPRTFAVYVAHSGAGSWTYSLGYALTI